MKFKKGIIITVIGTAFMTGIANGLRIEIIKPLLNYLVLLVIKIMSFIFSSYKDNIYLEVSNGFHEFASVQMLAIIWGITGFLYLIIVKIHPLHKSKKSSIGVFINTKKGYYTLYVISTIVFITLLLSSVKLIYVNQIITYSEKSIHIVNPYIQEQERLSLKSQFYSIKNSNDYYNFNQHLKDIEEKNKEIELPKINIF